ncbi:MAG: DUF192 domain-containing protein [Candidatus Omnitrophica bacterium]|nr:DUF192 domain-containing protein [Candidatus Omnitrophota bacterium]HOX54305.1 DUF192 domain-containing protein [Candidatus Omnitrophota bacterium]
MKVVNLTRGTILADKAILAESFFSRLKGLLGRGSLAESEALIISPCNAIHTFFMRFSIDVLFLDKAGKVVALKEKILPFRVTPVYPRAWQVVELPIQAISRSKTQLNDQIKLEN